MTTKIKCVHNDGRVMYFIPESANDPGHQKATGFYPDANQDETDEEAISLSKNFQGSVVRDQQSSTSSEPESGTADDANLDMMQKISAENKDENDRIDDEEKEIANPDLEDKELEEEFRGRPEKEIPLEINEEDAEEDEPAGEESEEEFSGKKTKEKQEARPKAKRR